MVVEVGVVEVVEDVAVVDTDEFDSEETPVVLAEAIVVVSLIEVSLTASIAVVGRVVTSSNSMVTASLVSLSVVFSSLMVVFDSLVELSSLLGLTTNTGSAMFEELGVT